MASVAFAFQQAVFKHGRDEPEMRDVGDRDFLCLAGHATDPGLNGAVSVL